MKRGKRCWVGELRIWRWRNWRGARYDTMTRGTKCYALLARWVNKERPKKQHRSFEMFRNEHVRLQESCGWGWNATCSTKLNDEESPPLLYQPTVVEMLRFHLNFPLISSLVCMVLSLASSWLVCGVVESARLTSHNYCGSIVLIIMKYALELQYVDGSIDSKGNFGTSIINHGSWICESFFFTWSVTNQVSNHDILNSTVELVLNLQGQIPILSCDVSAITMAAGRWLKSKEQQLAPKFIFSSISGEEDTYIPVL